MSPAYLETIRKNVWSVECGPNQTRLKWHEARIRTHDYHPDNNDDLVLMTQMLYIYNKTGLCLKEVIITLVQNFLFTII